MSTPTTLKRGKKQSEKPAKGQVPSEPDYIIGRPGALLRLQPRQCDKEAHLLLFGDGLLTLEGVAMEFGITVDEAQEWARQGMPMAVPSAAGSASTLPPTNDYNPPNRRCCELLRRLQPTEFFALDISLLLGFDIWAETQAEVAKAFGVGLDAAKQWFAMGAPKPPKGKPYNLISVLAWRVRADVLGAER